MNPLNNPSSADEELRRKIGECLNIYHEVSWAAYTTSDDSAEAYGSTPRIALLNLTLALHKRGELPIESEE